MGKVPIVLMIESGKHCSLPTIVQRPRSSSHSGREAPTEKSVLPAKNPAQKSKQQAVSLFAETNRYNLQIATGSQNPEQCGASENAVKSTLAADPFCRTKHSSAGQEEFKENSLPPSTVSVDHKLSNHAPDNEISCNESGALTQTVPVVVNSSPASTSLPAHTSYVIMQVQPVHINIHSVRRYQYLPPQLDLGVGSVVSSTISSETVSEQYTVPCRPELRIPTLHLIDSSESDSDAHSKQVPGIPFSDKRSSTPLSFRNTRILPKSTTTKSPQYQCPKCLQRFDRVMAQLQHKCHPQRIGRGSLLDRPPLKLFKCLECFKEFSDLEAKIRHNCSALKDETHTNDVGSEARRSSHEGETGTQAKIRNIKCLQNLCGTQQSTSNGEKKNNGTTKEKLIQTGIQKNKSFEPDYHQPFKCGICSKRYKAVSYLKNHIASHVGSQEHKRNKLPYVCQICKTHFRWSKNLKRHFEAKCHGKNRNAGLEQIENLSSEMITESSKKGPSEEVNNAASKTSSIQDGNSSSVPRSKVSRSQLQPRQIDQHKCGICGITWDSATTLRKHVRSHWKEIFESPKNPLICSRCNEEFDNCVKLFLHVRRNDCTTASEDTSQSDEDEARVEGRMQASIDKPQNSNSSRPEVKTCDTRKNGNYSCSHCGLTFWRTEMLNIHIQSSHPLLPDQAEVAVKTLERSNRNPKKHVRSSEERVLYTRASEPASSNQDLSVTDQNTDSSMRTGIYPCRCNICNLDFSDWIHLNDHRRAHHHHLLLSHLKLGLNQQGGPDESLDEASVDIMKDDIIHACDLCSRVFRQWRSLTLHKKAKHHVRGMFARYSAPSIKPNQEAANLPSSDLTSQQKSNFTDDINLGNVEQVPHLGGETQDNSHIPIRHSVEAEATTEKSTNICRDVSSLPSCDSLQQHQLPGVDLENEGSSSQRSQHLGLSERVKPSTDMDLGLGCSLFPISEPRLTVEDLKISSVVSLYDLTADSMQWQRQKTVCDLSAHSEPSKKILEEVPFNVKANVPMSTLNVLEDHRSTPLCEMISTLPTAQEQQNSRNAFSFLIDSVLGMESLSQRNIFDTVSVVGQNADAISNALSYSELGWHGTMKKITFLEAKNILTVLKKNSISNCYHCPVCGEWFKGIPYYASHILAHCDMEKYRCSFCGQTDLNIFVMLNHVIRTHCMPCEQNESTTNQDESTPTKTKSTENDAKVDEPEVMELCEVSDPDSSFDHQEPDTNFPRSGYDYIFEPSRLESHLRRHAKTDSYECPLCPFQNKKKCGLIYHLRIHHELHPYRCRHCQQRFNFIPDVQVHFLQYHCHTAQESHQPAGQQQAGTTLENQVSSLDRKSLPQETISSVSACQTFVAAEIRDHYLVPSDLTGSSGPALISSQSSDEASRGLPANTSNWTLSGTDSVTEQQHRTSDSLLESGSPPKVKVKRLSEDEVKIPNCMMEGTTSSPVKNEGITIKTEFPDECDCKGVGWINQTDDDLVGFEDRMSNDISSCSTLSKSFMREMQEDDRVNDAEVVVSDLMTAEKEHAAASMISQSEGVSELDVVKDSNGNHKDVTIEEEISHSTSHEIKNGAADISNSDGLDEVCKVAEEPESTCRGYGEILTEDSGNANVDDRRSGGATMEYSVINSNTFAEGNPNSTVQPLDDLFRLASDIGIIVTGSQVEENVSGENSAAQQISLEIVQNYIPGVTEDKGSNVSSVTNLDIEQAAELVSRGSVGVLQGQQTNNSCKLQECAPPVADINMNVDEDQNVESTVNSREEHKNQTALSFLKKRSLEESSDSQGALKRQKLESPPSVTIENNSAGDVTILDGCRKSTLANPSHMGLSSVPVLIQAKEELVADNPFHDIDLGEDQIMSDTLERITKNCFTSRILKSFEKDSLEPVLSQNSLDLDLISGHQFASTGEKTSTVTEKEYKPMSEEKQHSSLVNLEHTMGNNISGFTSMPKIFDVAGNGQMPVVPSGIKDSPQLTIAGQYFNRAVLTKDVDHIRGTTHSCVSLEGPLTNAEHSGTLEPRCPTGEPCYPLSEETLSDRVLFNKRRSGGHLRTLLEYSSREPDQNLNRPRHLLPPPDDHSGNGLLDAQSRNSSLSCMQEEQKFPPSNQQTRQSMSRQNQWGRSWDQNAKPELASPEAIGRDNRYHCLPGRNSTDSFQDDRVQESWHCSSKAHLYNRKQPDSYQCQELYRDSHQRSYPVHSPQEYIHVPKHFQASHDHQGALRRENQSSMACTPSQTEANVTYSQQNVNSRGLCWTNNDQQELRSPVVKSRTDAQRRDIEPITYQLHHSRPCQHLDGHSSNHKMSRCSRSYDSLDHQFMSPDVDIQHVPSNRSMTFRDYQRAQMSADSRVDSSRTSSDVNHLLKQTILSKQHSVPSSSSSPRPGNMYGYRRKGQPVSSETRERHIDEPKQVASRAVQQQRSFSSRTWYPPVHPEENVSGFSPRIVSVSSLHPRYMNRMSLM